MSPPSCIHWFRKGMRIHDNPSLLSALEKEKSGYYQLRPLYILDPEIKRFLRAGPNRWRFLQQSLEDLDKNLRKIGSRLYLLRGEPESVFTEIFKEWNVKKLTYETDIEPYALKRDTAVTKLAESYGIEIVTKVSHTIYDPELIIAKNMGTPPLKVQKWISLAESLPAPPKPLPAPDSVPLEARAPLDNDKYLIPTLEELGLDPSKLEPCLHPGGETEALRRMKEHLARKDYICKFEKPNTSPNSLEPSTTVLSPYLKFGCLSARLFYYGIKEVISGRAHSKPPVSLIGQLYWREFYYTAAAGTPNFDKMVGNPICVQVPWDKNPEYLEAWTYVFEELLLDADWALNAGNWMWLSASAFFSQFYRVYSPVAFGKKTDKLGDYIRKYVPEVKKLPPQYIYEPWEAPLSIQKQAGCIVGTDYPKRVVIHEQVYKKNIGRMSAAYKQTKEDKASAEKSTSPGKSSSKSAGKRPSSDEPTVKKPKSKSIKEFFKD